jgi:hypothetical protein
VHQLLIFKIQSVTVNKRKNLKISDKMDVTGRKKPIQTFSMLKQPYTPSICIKQHDDFIQRITDAEFISVAQAPAIVIHIFAKPRLHTGHCHPVRSHSTNCHRCQSAPTLSLCHMASATSPLYSVPIQCAYSFTYVSCNQPPHITRSTIV